MGSDCCYTEDYFHDCMDGMPLIKPLPPLRDVQTQQHRSRFGFSVFGVAKGWGPDSNIANQESWCARDMRTFGVCAVINLKEVHQELEEADSNCRYTQTLSEKDAAGWNTRLVVFSWLNWNKRERWQRGHLCPNPFSNSFLTGLKLSNLYLWSTKCFSLVELILVNKKIDLIWDWFQSESYPVLVFMLIFFSIDCGSTMPCGTKINSPASPACVWLLIFLTLTTEKDSCFMLLVEAVTLVSPRDF